MSKRVLLVDADVVAYNAAFGAEKATEWEPGYWTWHCSWQDVVEAFDIEVQRIKESLAGDEIKLCLTDSVGNFRHTILPSYKGARKNVRKPIVLKAFKQWLIDERGAYFRPGLEGDDCMGILATLRNPTQEERIIVSVDKDMKTIPGKFVRWGVTEKILEVTEAEADYWHLYQTLTGDVTDGYKGCPGVGPKAAEALLPPQTEETANTLVEWVDVAWARIVTAFEKVGLCEEEALRQARVARILRASNYDFIKKEPILWTPDARASLAKAA